jgi:LacI family transcriptional regulator
MGFSHRDGNKPLSTTKSERRKLPVTLKDVALRTDVHMSTVSRALNPRTRHLVAKELTEKILRVAEELGYRLNLNASGLRSRHSMTIGVILPDVAQAVFPETILAIETVLAARGYSVLVAHAETDYPRHRLIVEQLASHLIDGLIMTTARRHDPVIEYCIENDLPMVTVHRHEPNFSSVMNDDRQSMHLAVQHLLALGHRRIAHVGGSPLSDSGRLRREGFEETLREAGLRPAAIEHSQRYTREEGLRCATAIFEKAPDLTALVSASDSLAIGCLDYMAKHGIDCPGQVSITGHNNAPLVDAIDPPLTTVAVDLAGLGTHAAELMLRQIDDRSSPAEQIILEPKLVVRASTVPVSDAGRKGRA